MGPTGSARLLSLFGRLSTWSLDERFVQIAKLSSLLPALVRG